MPSIYSLPASPNLRLKAGSSFDFGNNSLPAHGALPCVKLLPKRSMVAVDLPRKTAIWGEDKTVPWDAGKLF
jgi:hypothetical protein